jgi:hypothetical protein
LDESENQVSDDWCEPRGTAAEKFYWRPVAPFKRAAIGAFSSQRRVKCDSFLLPFADG